MQQAENTFGKALASMQEHSTTGCETVAELANSNMPSEEIGAQNEATNAAVTSAEALAEVCT